MTTEQDNESESATGGSGNNNNMIIIALGVLLVIVILIFCVVAGVLLFPSISGGGEATAAPPAGATLPPVGVATLPPLRPSDTPPPPVTLPTADPQEPTGRVIAPDGVFVRTGPGSVYPALGAAPFGTVGEIVGKNANGTWWVFQVPGAPNEQGWADAAFIEASGAESVPIVPAPPLPQPTATATSAATPSPILYFSANPTTIGQGSCSTLSWQVQNVQAVWVYPLGEPYQNYPVTGTGTKQVCPSATTIYEMRVELATGAIFLQQVTVTVVANNPLANSSWRVANFFVNQVPIQDTTLTAVFGGDANISVNGGCNTFNGTYSVNGNNISIGPLAGTQVFCSNEINAQEQTYINALMSATSYQLNLGQLILFDSAGQELLRFNRTG